MTQHETPSTGAQLAIASLALLGSLGGWLIVNLSGFHHQPSRSSPRTVFVDGPEAAVMAAILFTLSAVACAALLQARRWPRWTYAVVCGAVILAPALYVAVR